MRALLLILALAAPVPSLAAQAARASTATRDSVDRYTAAEMARRHIPGVALAVVRGGKVVKAVGYGVADLENDIAVTPQTVFKIGSVSKQFLATGIMLLAQDGRLSVDDPVSKHFAGTPESWFRPMGMTATRTTTTRDLVPRRAHGYAWRDSMYTNAPEYLALRPSGAFLSTVLDLAKWDAALYRDLPLTKASREAMWTPVRLTGGGTFNYGFGWSVDSLDGHWRVEHGGALPGFRAEMARFPNDSLTIIVLTNADDARPDQMAENVAKIYFAARKR